MPMTDSEYEAMEARCREVGRATARRFLRERAAARRPQPPKHEPSADPKVPALAAALKEAVERADRENRAIAAVDAVGTNRLHLNETAREYSRAVWEAAGSRMSSPFWREIAGASAQSTDD